MFRNEKHIGMRVCFMIVKSDFSNLKLKDLVAEMCGTIKTCLRFEEVVVRNAFHLDRFADWFCGIQL